MAVLPIADYRPVVNHGGRRSAHLGIVVHVQVGYGSLFGQFNDPSSQTSSHFWVSEGGLVEQYLDTELESWAQEAGNAGYLSVETEGTPEEGFTVPQALALRSLIFACQELEKAWPLVLVDHGSAGVTTHAHYPSEQPDPAWGNHACPGPVRTAALPGLILPAPADPATPRPGPTPLTPEEESTMIAVTLPNGKVAVYAIGAGSRAGQLLEFTRTPGDQKGTTNSVIDVTDQIAGPDPYTVSG